MTSNPYALRGAPGCLVAAALVLATVSARAQPAPPPGEPDDDVELTVPATPASTATPPSSAAPPPSAAPPSSAPPPTPASATPPASAAPPASAPAPDPSSAPAPAGALATTSTAGAPATPSTADARSPAGRVGLPTTTAPAARSDAPPSLVAEGSNYVRPIRRGLAWWGFVQAQYQRNDLSEDQLAPGGEPLNQDEFSLRRARLRIDHGWENAAATLEMDASTLGGVRIGPRRAEASLLYRGAEDDTITPRLVLTAGITDLPFGAEIGESQRDRVFMERSIGSTALFPSEADIGVKLWGAYRFLNYAVAVVNGQPLFDAAFPRDPVAAKDIVGRVGARAPVDPSLVVEGGVSFWNGTGFSPGRDATKASVTWIDDNNNGFAEPHELQGVTGSAAVPSQTFRRWALGLDLGASKRTALGVSRLSGEVAVASNLDRALLVSDPILSGADVRQLVLSVAAVQQITDYGLVGFRAAYYDPNSDVFEQRAGVFHIKDESFWVLSPTLGLTLSHGRLVAQYDVVADQLARDDRGVPTNAKNNQLTLRLQVDL
ncbi:MAG: hypothetical protein KF850_13830 [Labilithrix sp.]|nr:hypothetical protein [Labilithrix sp.]